MNILFLSHRVPYPPNKGEKIRTFNQLKHLHEKGHKISVCAPLEQAEDSEYFKHLSQEFCEQVKFSPLSNKPLRLIKGLLMGKALSVANFYTGSLQQQFDKLIQQSSFDAIICTSSAMAEYIYNSQTLTSLKIKPQLLMDFMDLDSDKWKQYSNSSNIPMKWIYQREAKLLGRFEAQITHDFAASFFIADAEVELFKKQCQNHGQVLTMGNGMDTTLFTPSNTPPNNENPVFLFTGVMDYKPNIDAVVWFVETIWEGIIKQYPKARFIIAGMNPIKAVSELTKIQGVEVTGFVDDILPYYHESDYFVAPFRIARGVQNKVLQAFSCGLPVISTPMGAEGIACQENKHLLLANNRDEFLGCVNLLESNKNLQQEIRSNALALISSHYSWQGMMQVLDNVLLGEEVTD